MSFEITETFLPTPSEQRDEDRAWEATPTKDTSGRCPSPPARVSTLKVSQEAEQLFPYTSVSVTIPNEIRDASFFRKQFLRVINPRCELQTRSKYAIKCREPDAGFRAGRSEDQWFPPKVFPLPPLQWFVFISKRS